MAVASRRRDAVALIGVVVLLLVVVWVVREIHTSQNPDKVAPVLNVYLGVAGLVVSLLAFLLPWWWKGRRITAVVVTAAQLTAAADQLAQSMLNTWRQQARQRRISTPAPVRVWWRWGPPEVTPPLAGVSTVPVSGTGPRPLPGLSSAGPSPDQPGVLLDAGIVTQLHEEVYSNLPHGRLVLLGGPGAGKTGAMILLLLAALEHRRNMPEAHRGEIPVPVWLTLGGWDPTTQTLHQWAAATMDRDHSYLRAREYGSDAAAELLRAGKVALFLDGLDEMAPSAQGQALARIEREGASLRLVLSSRPEEYRNAISEERVHNTAVIELQPVDPQEARDYLLRDQIGAQRERWAQLGEYLTDHPDSIAAHALNTPLTLSLARATYHNQDPTPLTNPATFATVAALREHLIDRILSTAYPNEAERAHATHWLAWIAHHLGPDRDIAWWRIPTWIPRWQLRLIIGLAVGLMGVLAGVLAGVLTSVLTFMLAFGLAGVLAVGLTDVLTDVLEVGRVVCVTGLVVGLVGGLASEVGKEPQAIFPRRPAPRELAILLAFGLVTGLAGVLVFGLAFGLMVWLVSVLVVLLVDWTVPLPRGATATPTATYRIDRRTSTVSGLAVGLAVVPAFVLGLGLAVGLAGGLAFGFTVWLAFVLSGGSMKVSLTELILAITAAGQVKFIRMLEDAHHRQVLRQAGAVYQFRHAELQDHLAKIHHSHPQPPTST
jgi:hypothetical protein